MANADEVKTNANDGAAAEATEATKETAKEVKETKEEVKEAAEEKKEPIVLTKDLEAKIIRQVEYYFGDINLPKDKFLQEQISLEDGWVPITVLLTFKRLLSICPDADTIAQALINADNNLVIVNDDKKKIRRNPEMPFPEYNEDRRKELTSRTAYVKGFPADETLEVLMKYFEPFGPFESIHMRSYKDKAIKKQVFKGSIFITFKTVDECKGFLEKEEVKYNDTVLIKKWQSEYMEEKKKEREERNEKRGKNKKDPSEADAPPKHTFPKGAIAHMKGFKDTTVRETIKKEVTTIFEKEPAYITFDKGDTEGYLRFPEDNGAVDFVAKLTDAKFTVDEAEITVRALEGDEEETFLKDLSQTLTRMRNQNRNFGKNKNRKRKGGGDGGPRSKYSRK